MDNQRINNDEQIVYLLGMGDPHAIRMIFDRYYSRLCAYAMRYPLTYEDTEDVVQSVMISFWCNKNNTDFSGSLRAYLFSAVDKNALKRMRDNKQCYFTQIESSSNDLAENIIASTEDNIQFMRYKLDACINDLPKQQQRIVKEIAISNKPYKEVASNLGNSINTVKTHYVRALRQLRAKMDR